MQITVKFERKGEVLTRFEWEVKEKADFGRGIDAAYDQFHSDHPDVTLFDDVAITFDKTE